MTTRRMFLKVGALAGTSLTLRNLMPKAWAFCISGQSLRKFIIPLPGLGPTGIPAASPDKSKYPGVDYYKITMGQFQQHLHPDLPAPTTLWGYADVTGGQPNFRYLGGAIVAQENRPVRIKFTNELPNKHPLPVDTSLMGAEPDQPVNRATAHLHGGFVPWVSDGGPFTWFTPDGKAGESRLKWLPDNNRRLTDDLWYPNAQSSRLMWYHDHAMGITRLNAYAGLATAYILRDDFENALIAAGILPGKVAGTEIPLIIQDKAFKCEDDAFGKAGDLDYPMTQEAGDVAPGFPPIPFPSCVPEFFAETMLVNGAPYPYVQVQQRRYRLRILNACQARFLNLQLYYAKNGLATEANLGAPGPAMVQIGTEGGFLPEPVVLNSPPMPLTFDPVSGVPTSYTLLLAPAERADIIVDFSHVPVGAKLVLYNDAVAPFPSGDPTVGGEDQSPDTQNILQFQVTPRVGARDDPFFMPRVPIQRLMAKHAHRVRNLTLNEDVDEFGRLIQRLGTDEKIYPDTFARNYMDSPTEVVHAGSTEVWAIFNNTMDTHPIHFHLSNVQVLGRRAFTQHGDKLVPHGKIAEPDANERGWKETVRMNPGQVTYVIMKFDLPRGPAGVRIPDSPRTGGAEYVWHCHILEHEEHDMMRPLVVL
jgi:spore coat protein A, manganese oxidase